MQLGGTIVPEVLFYRLVFVRPLFYIESEITKTRLHRQMDCVPQASRVVPPWLIERGPDPISIAMAIGSGSVRLELALLLLISP